MACSTSQQRFRLYRSRLAWLSQSATRSYMSMTVMMILLQGRSGEAVTVRLRGRVDGWLEGEGAIVEVKNRCVGAT